MKRLRVREDFLIIANTSTQQPVSFTEYINGSFIETGPELGEAGYTHRELIDIEKAFLWYEKNLRYPQINFLEGVGFGLPDSPNNQRWMRVFTTLTLTHSNGYIVYQIERNTGTHLYYDRIWYDFWDTDLGRPVGGAETKGQLYDNRDGVFVREFTNGWAIYNRSGKKQQIEFTGSTTSVSSGIKGHAHTLADLDGEIYLKADEIVDIKEDGVVDIDVTNIEDATEWVPDANLRMAVTEQLREKVALPEGVPLRKDQMRLLRNLSIDGLKISDLTGLEHAVFLQHLDASGNEITDLQPLANLVHLNSITLNENQISDISPLANLLSLASLNLSKNIISDITPLKHLTKLIKLSLADNLIEDITIVANLENLLELRLNGNLITDISPILNLPALEALNIKGNPVKNISPLFALDLVEFEYDEEQLEAEPSADVNGDGVVNIQDLVIVANALGKAEPDLNGDGVVNIQDLIIVANAFE